MSREFFFLKTDRMDHAELSCQKLYMRYLDAAVDGTASEFFRTIGESLSGVKVLYIADPSWLNCEELKPLESVLAAFRRRGGRVEYPRAKEASSAQS